MNINESFFKNKSIDDFKTGNIYTSVVVPTILNEGISILSQKNVLLIRCAKDYYYCPELQMGFWDYPLQSKEQFVGDIKCLDYSNLEDNPNYTEEEIKRIYKMVNK